MSCALVKEEASQGPRAPAANTVETPTMRPITVSGSSGPSGGGSDPIRLVLSMSTLVR